MQKYLHLNDTVLDRMITGRTSDSEIKFLFNLIGEQDREGRVRDVYYKDVYEKYGIQDNNFYRIVSNLETKGVIEKQRIVVQGEHNIYSNDFIILNNAYGKETYLDLGEALFQSLDFWKLTARRKLLCMDLVRDTREGTFHTTLEELNQRYEGRLFRVGQTRKARTYDTDFSRILFFEFRKYGPENYEITRVIS